MLFDYREPSHPKPLVHVPNNWVDAKKALMGIVQQSHQPKDHSPNFCSLAFRGLHLTSTLYPTVDTYQGSSCKLIHTAGVLQLFVQDSFKIEQA